MANDEDRMQARMNALNERLRRMDQLLVHHTFELADEYIGEVEVTNGSLKVYHNNFLRV